MVSSSVRKRFGVASEKPYRLLLAAFGAAYRAELFVALAIWFLALVVPGVVMSARVHPADRLLTSRGLASRIGPEVAGYLGYAPGPIVLHALTSVTCSSFIILLLALSLRSPAAHTKLGVGGTSFVLVAMWATLCLLGPVLLAIAMLARGGDSAWGWAVPVALQDGLAGLLAVAVGTVAVVPRFHRWVGWVLAALAAGAIVSWGAAEQRSLAPCSLWSSASIGRCLLSGRADLWFRGVTHSLLWLIGGVAMAGGLRWRLGRRGLP